MSRTHEMTIDEHYKYLQIKQKQYVQANRKERGKILDEMQSVTKLARNTLPLGPAICWAGLRAAMMQLGMSARAFHRTA